MRQTALLAAMLLAACSAPAGSAQPASPTAVPEPTGAVDAAGVQRLCDALDIVSDDISLAYTDMRDDPVARSLVGLAVVTAGSDIEDLADGVDSSQIASDIQTLGQRFQEEGDSVQEGHLGGGEAMAYYLELVERYGSHC